MKAVSPLKVIFLAALLNLTPASSKSATVINTYPDWDGTITYGWDAVAQSFVAPADNTLLSWKFGIAPATNGSPNNNVLFQIVAWDQSSGPVGAALFSREVAWPSAGGDILVDNIGLTLTPGSRYAAIANLENRYEGQSVHFQLNQTSYNGGNASWFSVPSSWQYLDSTWNTQFRAEFAAIPEPGTVPLILLSLLMLLRVPRRRF
jgi:hypothetical protein